MGIGTPLAWEGSEPLEGFAKALGMAPGTPLPFEGTGTILVGAMFEERRAEK
jgi:hypothetical protein